MSEKDPCVICNVEQADTLQSQFDGIHQNCPRCGEFKVSGTALSMAGQGLGKDKRAKLSGWVLSQNRAGEVPMVTSSNIKSIVALPLPSVSERALSLLQEAEEGILNLGDRFNIKDPRFLAATYSSNQNDVTFLINLLAEQGFAKLVAMGGGV